MKRHILTLAFFLIAAFVAAQKPAVSPNDASVKEDFSLFSHDSWIGRFQKQQHKVVAKLGLDEQQQRSLDTMNDIYVTQRAAFFDDKGLDRHDRKEDIKQLQRERYAKFTRLLTSEQLKKWEELRKGQKKKVLKKK